jgi:DNA-binding MarR family transcriptional regulator
MKKHEFKLAAARKETGAPRARRSSRDAAKAARPANPPKAPMTVSREELLIDGTDRSFRVLVQGLLKFLAVHAAIRDGYASLVNLPGPRYTILLCIRNLCDAGPVNIRTVADHLRLSGSYVTIETKALEQMGLVSKERGADDRRMVSLSVTPKGTALLDSIASLRQRINDVEFEPLSKEEFQMLVPVIERLVQSGERALALQNYLRAHRMDAMLEDAPSARARELA